MSEPVDFYEEQGPLGEAPRSEVHLSEYWAILVKRRKLIYQCMAVALAVAVISAALSKSEYEATVVLNVERDRGSLLDVTALEQGTGGYDPDYLPTQIRLMKSREIAERVAQKLNLPSDPVFNPRKGGVIGKAEPLNDADRAERVARSRAASARRRSAAPTSWSSSASRPPPRSPRGSRTRWRTPTSSGASRPSSGS